MGRKKIFRTPEEMNAYQKKQRELRKKRSLEYQLKRNRELEGYKNFWNSLNEQQRDFLLKMMDYENRKNWKNPQIEEFLEEEYKLNNGVVPYDDRKEFEILRFERTDK